MSQTEIDRQLEALCDEAQRESHRTMEVLEDLEFGLLEKDLDEQETKVLNEVVVEVFEQAEKCPLKSTKDKLAVLKLREA